MDVFFYSLLAFSLVYFVGLVSQLSDIPLSSKSQIKKGFPQLATRGHSDQKKREKNKKKHSYSSKVLVDGESDCVREFEQIENANMNLKMPTQSSLIHGFCLILFYIVKKWNICFYLNFFFFIFICVTATDSHTGQRWATREGGGNIQYLHMFFRGQWGLHLKTEQSLCSETTLTDVRCSGWSVFYGAGFRPIVCQWTHVTPVSFAALNHWQGGSSAKQTSAQHKRRLIFVLFCFHGTRYSANSKVSST